MWSCPSRPSRNTGEMLARVSAQLGLVRHLPQLTPYIRDNASTRDFPEVLLFSTSMVNVPTPSPASSKPITTSYSPLLHLQTYPGSRASDCLLPAIHLFPLLSKHSGHLQIGMPFYSLFSIDVGHEWTSSPLRISIRRGRRTPS